MGRFDVSKLRFMSYDELRMLVGIEMGMKNHEYVPEGLIKSIAGVKKINASKTLKNLCKDKLAGFSGGKVQGYTLTYLGYDYLALNTLVKREEILGIERKLGVGKEADIYIAISPTDERFVLKFHRLGRTSFRSVKKNRDYMDGRLSTSWIYLSRLAAMREFAYLKALYDIGFPVPRPIDVNRHCIAMDIAKGVPLQNVGELPMPDGPKIVYDQMMECIYKLALCGLIHGDFNEFNTLLDENLHLTFIDVPQMVSVSHVNAKSYFERDVNCVRVFFKRRFRYEAEYRTWEEVLEERRRLEEEKQKTAGASLEGEEKEESPEGIGDKGIPEEIKEASHGYTSQLSIPIV
ncbi:Serine/threonine-protein kinase RIO2, partial [Aduncisulcus paluster]